ncbi:MAG: hypothetical protein AMXMBFR12_01210 [Candidatus Babeliales bacterium]
MASISFVRYVLLVGFAAFSITCHAWQTLVGDTSSRTDQTFSFGIKSHYAQPANQIMLVGAEHAQEGKEYSLAKISLYDYKITSCAPEFATVKGIFDQPNPLYNACIPFIACPNSTQAVVYNPAYKSTLFLTNHYGSEAEVLSVEIKDNEANECQQITGLETNGENVIFAALITQNNQCGIAIVSYSEKTEKVEVSDEELKKMEKELTESKNDEKTVRRLKKGLEMGQDDKPYRNVTTKNFVQESIILLPKNIKEITSLCWHAAVGCLYLGITYDAPVNNQTCAILVGSLSTDKKSIKFESFTNSYLDLFHDGTIDAMCPFSSSTGALDYLLIKNSSMPNLIYSLAVCNQRVLSQREAFEFQGKLADSTIKPIDVFISTRNKFLGRQFMKPLVGNPDISSLIGYQVGYSQICAGSIQEIMVRGDVVFAVILDAVNGYSSGIYQSQALFDDVGRISGWTFWQKTLEYEGVDFALINNAKANVMIFAQDIEGEKGTRNVQVNTWQEKGTDEIAQLIEVAQKEFVESKQEIKKVIDFSILTPGLLSKNLTLLMSDTKILLAQMPHFASVVFDRDSFKEIGTPTCAQIGISDDQGWLFIGGTNGLAKMVDDNHEGWQMPHGLHHINQFQGMQCQLMGNYTMVRKLLFDQGSLYVLTDTQFDRIDLRTNQTVCLATTTKLCNQRYSIFYDAIVSDKCALLATSAGLYRVGNTKNIMRDDEQTLNWTLIKVPEATDLPLFLMPVSVTGNPHDWAKGPGQIYIITGSYTKKGAHVHRFAVQDVANHEITDVTIAPVPDLVYKDRIADIGSLLTCSDCFLTDGLFYLAPYKQKKSKPMLLYNGLARARGPITLNLEVEDTITCITRNSMHGNWLVAGSFGLKTNI